MIKKPLTILVLAPHIDDGEFWAGGSLARWIEEGNNVYYVAFCAPPDPKEGKPIVLQRELSEATKALGFTFDNVRFSGFPLREFARHRQDILDYMIHLRNETNPDIVVLPSSNDTHQDHRVVSEEGFRAFKLCSIIGYESPYNNLQFKTGMYVKLEKKHIERKIAAIKKYKSQEGRIYANKEFFYGLARVRGTQIGEEFAECFEIVRLIV